MGDSSDNIPGIKGVGEKTALKLLHQYGTIDRITGTVRMKSKVRWVKKSEQVWKMP